jgi:pyridoxal phosphate enzyme (YggS family)
MLPRQLCIVIVFLQLMSATLFRNLSVSERLADVRARIGGAAIRSERSAEEIVLVAVSKTHPPQLIREAIAAGITDLGENKVQEAEEKIPQVGRDSARWHLVGHLQSNKARKAATLFDLIHSIDSVALAQRLERICDEQNRKHLPVLIQMDLASEETKSGAAESELPKLINAFKEFRRVKLQGLMTLPPFYDNPEDARPFFRRLRELRDELRSKGAFGDGRGELSMGMTHDFEIAIDEGATMVRVGTALFGERSKL